MSAATGANATIHLALTSHGFGHMTRALTLARALLDHAPVDLIVSTEIAEARIGRELDGRPFRYRRMGYEPGAAQKNCFEVDREGTRAAYARFFAAYDERLRAEERFLDDSACRAVIADIPALPIRAAARRGIPAIGVSSFTWDWILEPYVEGTADSWFVERLAADYHSGAMYFRLPLGPEASPFPRAEEAPLVGRRAQLSREETRRRIGLGAGGERIALVCPGGWSASDWETIRVDDPGAFSFLFVGDLPVEVEAPVVRLSHELPGDIGFADLVGAADVVLTKPGYGIASECLLERTPLTGIERRDFREAPELVGALRAAGPFAEISLADFFAGCWREALEQAIGSSTPWAPVAENGAVELAARIADFLELGARESNP